MIELRSGDLFKTDCEAIVNTVNCVGVMGKGIALQFKKAYPDNFKAYEKACRENNIEPGKMFVFSTGQLFGPKYIINFPTKRHWREPSKISYIKDGLDDLKRVLKEYRIASVAMPPLGCGNGGLDWHEVENIIKKSLVLVPDVRILLFAPSGAPDSSTQIIRTKTPAMTSFVATMMLLIKRYLWEDMSLSRLEIQKLAYFEKVSGDPHFATMKFAEREYGPYSDGLAHALHRMDGHYLNNCGDNNGPFQQIVLNESFIEKATSMINADEAVKLHLQRVFDLIDGFEDPFGMELLSSVHWVARNREVNAETLEDAVAAVHSWNSHKRQNFKLEHIKIAWARLKDLGWI